MSYHPKIRKIGLILFSKYVIKKRILNNICIGIKTKRGDIVQYKKFEQKGYNLHVIETNRFKNIEIRFNFKRPIKKR